MKGGEVQKEAGTDKKKKNKILTTEMQDTTAL
jgi:hypothetical protein